MCGRFVSARKRLELLEEFSIERDRATDGPDSEPDPDYNVAPTKRVFAVVERRGEDDEPPARELRVLRWGLVPFWAKDSSGGGRLINARAETVAVKPAFRRAFAKRRCILPADGYYEWMPLTDQGKQRKQPYFIYRRDGGALAFAGVYELWRDEALPEDHERAWLWTAAIITTQATDDVGQIHDRMPMVIAPDHWADWLNPDNSEPGQLQATMLPAMAGGLTSHPVSTAVNYVRNNGPELIAPVPADGGGSGGFRRREAATRRVVLSPRHAARAQPSLGCVFARGREARTPVETTVARKRLEEMRDDLDRSISILQGERPAPLAGAGYPHRPGRRGLQPVRDRPHRGGPAFGPRPAGRGTGRAGPRRLQQLRALRRLRGRRCRRPGSRPGRGGWLCQLPGQFAPSPPLACHPPLARRLRGLRADISSCAPMSSSGLAAGFGPDH